MDVQDSMCGLTRGKWVLLSKEVHSSDIRAITLNGSDRFSPSFQDAQCNSPVRVLHPLQFAVLATASSMFDKCATFSICVLVPGMSMRVN